MARTTRKFWTDGNWRDAAWDSDTPGEFTVVGNWEPRGKVHGGMLMSSSNTGLWNDHIRSDVFKRAIKRGQRQDVKAELWEQVEAYLAPDAVEEDTERFPLSGCCAECEADYVTLSDGSVVFDDYEYEDEFYDTVVDPYADYDIADRYLDYEGFATDDWREDYRVNWDLWWED